MRSKRLRIKLYPAPILPDTRHAKDYSHLFPAEIIFHEAFVPPTIKIAQAYQTAYDYFNEMLFETIFGEKLPHVVLNMSRKRGAVAFFAPGRWKAIKAGEAIHEISMVPEGIGRPVKDVFATLVHEMAHFKDHLDETACKNGRHGTAWFKIMKMLGLPGEPRNKSLTAVTHTIEAGAPYDLAFQAMPASLKMPFSGAQTFVKVKNPDSLQGLRTKYECPQCGSNVRGKVGLHIACLTCNETFYDSGI